MDHFKLVRAPPVSLPRRIALDCSDTFDRSESTGHWTNKRCPDDINEATSIGEQLSLAIVFPMSLPRAMGLERFSTLDCSASTGSWTGKLKQWASYQQV